MQNWAYFAAIFKKGNKCDPCNYRPISFTSIICKIMEPIIRNHIMEFFSVTTTSVKISMALW